VSKIMMFSGAPQLVLASGSRYRRALLDQVGLTYVTTPSEVDETPRAGETAVSLTARLARQKAGAVARGYPSAVVIGSDQVGTMDGTTTFSKPIDHCDAVAQLTRMSGQIVVFHTAVCVLNARTKSEQTAIVPTEVKFRNLSQNTIEAYLQRDRPYDCAGSAKIESLGIALVERVTSDDPTALVGLPMIALITLLAAEGIHVP